MFNAIYRNNTNITHNINGEDMHQNENIRETQMKISIKTKT